MLRKKQHGVPICHTQGRVGPAWGSRGGGARRRGAPAACAAGPAGCWRCWCMCGGSSSPSTLSARSPAGESIKDGPGAARPRAGPASVAGGGGAAATVRMRTRWTCGDQRGPGKVTARTRRRAQAAAGRLCLTCLEPSAAASYMAPRCYPLPAPLPAPTPPPPHLLGDHAVAGHVRHALAGQGRRVLGPAGRVQAKRDAGAAAAAAGALGLRLPTGPQQRHGLRPHSEPRA
jgi:hypothetical protein